MKNQIKSFYAALTIMLAVLPACAIQANQAADSTITSGPKTEPKTPATSATPNARVQETVQKLVELGPRVAGTPAAQQASEFLVKEYRQAGYQTTIQPFTYAKFRDLGSTIRVNGKTIAGQAMNNSIAGEVTARVIPIPKMGRPEDFATTNVKGAIAVVRRGEIPFSQKAENAAQAGAIGLIIVNSENTRLRGTLSQPAAIPMISIASGEGEPLLNPPTDLLATLAVKTQQQTITGRNVIAHRPGVTQPRLLLGGHYDSVAGSPGANDNASGTAVVLELARQLANTPMADQVWFVAFDGEEDGLQGSRFFVNSVQPQFLSGLEAMFNFDMVGINDRLLLSGSSKLKSRVKQLEANASDKTNGSSDHASFAAKGVPVLFFYRGMDPNYHSPGDRITNVEELNNTIQIAVESMNQVLQ